MTARDTLRDECAIRTIELEAPGDGAYPSIVCPVCGHDNLLIVCDEAEVDECPHLAFIYLGALGDFEFRSDDFAARMARLGPNAGFDIDDFDDFMAQVGYGHEMVVLAFDQPSGGHFRTVHRNLHGFLRTPVGESTSSS